MVFLSSWSSSSSVRMVYEGLVKEEKNMVILNSGSDVSLLPLSIGGEVDGPADDSQVQLRDCQGQELKVSGIKTASLAAKPSWRRSLWWQETSSLLSSALANYIKQVGQFINPTMDLC